MDEDTIPSCGVQAQELVQEMNPTGSQHDQELKMILAKAFQIARQHSKYSKLCAETFEQLRDAFDCSVPDIRAFKNTLLSFTSSPSSASSRALIGNIFLLGQLESHKVGCLDQFATTVKTQSLCTLIGKFSGWLGGLEQFLIAFLESEAKKLSNWPPSMIDEVLVAKLFSSSLAEPIFDVVNKAWASSTAQDDIVIASFSVFLLNTLNTLRCTAPVDRFPPRLECYRTYILTHCPELRHIYSNWSSLFPDGSVVTLIGFASFGFIWSKIDDDIESLELILDADGVRGCPWVDGLDDRLILAPPAQFKVLTSTMTNKKLTIRLSQVEDRTLSYCKLAPLSTEELIQRGKGCDGKTENQSEAFRLFKMAADRGSADGQYLAGMRLLERRGGEEDKKAGFTYLKKSADQGNCDAMVEVARCFKFSNGTDHCFKSKHLYEKTAALKGHGKAQYLLGWDYMYANTDVKGDFIEAYCWFSEAAKQLGDDKDVARELARCFEMGQGVGKNFVESLKWFTLAEHPDDLFKVAEMHERLKNINEAAKFYRLCIQRSPFYVHRIDARYRLASLLENGDGIAKDMSKAIELYTQAAEYGHREAQYRLGQILKHGIGGTNEDIPSAMRWFRQASDAKFPKGCYEYALCLLEGKGNAREDVCKAEELLIFASQNGICDAQLKLVHIWIEKAAANGSTEAQFLRVCCAEFENQAKRSKRHLDGDIVESQSKAQKLLHSSSTKLAAADS